MLMLEELQNKIRPLVGETAFLGNCGVNLRSCGCELVYFSFTGLTFGALEAQKAAWITRLETLPLKWEVVYLQSFPGTDKVQKLTCRAFCPHCRENYRLEKNLGVNSLVWVDKT